MKIHLGQNCGRKGSRLLGNLSGGFHAYDMVAVGCLVLLRMQHVQNADRKWSRQRDSTIVGGHRLHRRCIHGVSCGQSIAVVPLVVDVLAIVDREVFAPWIGTH